MKMKYAGLAALGLILSATLAGCKKDEPVKQEGAPAAQQAAAPPAAGQPVAPPQAAGNVVAAFNFEDGPQKWLGRKQTKLTQDTLQKKEGNAGLKVTGTAPKGDWDFAESPKFNLIPGKHYKFSGWVRVEEFKSPVPNSYCWLKIGIYKDNQWMKNVINNNYDLGKKGEWQLLSAEFDAPSEGNLTANFTLDKRPQDKAVSATIYLDDVRIEQTN